MPASPDEFDALPAALPAGELTVPDPATVLATSVVCESIVMIDLDGGQRPGLMVTVHGAVNGTGDLASLSFVLPKGSGTLIAGQLAAADARAGS
jgi:hypothetical protein